MKALLASTMAVVGLVIAPGAVSAQTDASISLVHGIPGATVDVVVGESVVIDGFAAGSIADISSFAGRSLEDVSVVDDATGDVLIGPIAELDVPDSGDWSYVAHLDADGTPVITSFENDISELPEGTARVTVRHTAEAPAVDLIVGDQRPVTNAENGDTAVLELPAGVLADAQLAPTGGTAIADIADLDLAADTNTVVYAVGSVDGNTLDFVVQIIELPVEAPADDSTTTSTTGAVPTAVGTGSPLDSGNTGLIVATVAGLVIAAGALVARRRI